MARGMTSENFMMGLVRTENALARAMMMAILPTSEVWKPRSPPPQARKAVMPPRPTWATSSVNTSRPMLAV